MQMGYQEEALLKSVFSTHRKGVCPPERLLFSENLLITSPMTPTAYAAGGVRTWLDDPDFPQVSALWKWLGTSVSLKERYWSIGGLNLTADGAAQHTVKG